jgi:hypothetical protein
MATAAPLSSDRVRDAAGFGGLVPSDAVARGGETLVLALSVEHHIDGVVIPLLVLSDVPGLIEWDPGMGLTVRDERGDRYAGEVLNAASGLGQLNATVWVEPSLPPDARRLELVVDGLARINPARGGGAGVTRPMGGGPWSLLIDLVPERTVVDPPPEPIDQWLPQQSGSVPPRAHGAFVDLVPVGQARLAEGAAVCVLAVERYWDRAVASLVALGPPGDEADAPAIGRAGIEVWDDRGNRYAATCVQGAARATWSEVAAEIVPAIDVDARALAIRVSDVPRGTVTGRGRAIPGPFTFGIRLPA